jgi:hypothetical protein
VVVAPAGNSGASSLLYPASSSYSVGVVGTDAQGAKDPVSNYGGAAEIGAPSVDVVAPFPRTQSRYGLWRGPSFAAPFHAGAVALAMQSRGASAQDASRALVAATQAYSYVPSPDVGKVGSGVLDLRPFLR